MPLVYRGEPIQRLGHAEEKDTLRTAVSESRRRIVYEELTATQNTLGASLLRARAIHFVGHGMKARQGNADFILVEQKPAGEKFSDGLGLALDVEKLLLGVAVHERPEVDRRRHQSVLGEDCLT